MKTKAQVSIDLLVTVLAALIFVSTIIAVSASIQETQSKLVIERQLKQQANEIASFISQANSIGAEQDSFSIEMAIEKITTATSKIYPTVSVAGGEVVVSAQGIEARKSFLENANNTVSAQDGKISLVKT